MTFPVCDVLEENPARFCAALAVVPTVDDQSRIPQFSQPSEAHRSGTMTFVRSGGRSFGITCLHVVETLRNANKSGQHYLLRTMLNGFYVVHDRFIQPLQQLGSPFTMDQLEELKQFTTERFRNHKAHPPRHALPDVPVKLRTQLNLFLPDHEMHAPAVWFEFKRWVDRTYRAYLKEAHGVRNVNELEVLARCIPVCYQKGIRPI